jgi:hypothetical protein
MKRADVIAFILIAVFILCLQRIAKGQCCEFKLVRNDTTLKEGIFLIEPKLGFQAKVTFEPVPATIHETFQTVGTWTKATNTQDPFLNKDVYFSNETGAQLILNFYGGRFQIITSKASHHGIATIQLNNGPEIPIDLYSSQRVDNVVVYDSPAPFGTNTIKIKVTGQRNPAATGNYIVIDYVKVI